MGFTKFIGDILNDSLGVSSSARQQYENQMKLQKDAQEFSKWQMQNAHQMEVEDLKKAGMNPVLSAGAGGGASAGVSMGSASAGTSGADPTAMIANILNMSNSVKQTEAQVKKAEAETGKTTVEAYKTLIDAGYSEESIRKAETERALILQEIENAKTAKDLLEAEKKIKEWDARHPLISRMLPAASAVTGGVIGGATAGALKNFTWTKPRKIGFNR